MKYFQASFKKILNNVEKFYYNSKNFGKIRWKFRKKIFLLEISAVLWQFWESFAAIVIGISKKLKRTSKQILKKFAGSFEEIFVSILRHLEEFWINFDDIKINWGYFQIYFEEIVRSYEDNFKKTSRKFLEKF